MTTSSDLNWLLLKNNNSFLVKRDGVQFSAEKNNLTNCNSYKFSGLANARSVGVSLHTTKDKWRFRDKWRDN
jgi:large subunit ribosomal protein L28e